MFWAPRDYVRLLPYAFRRFSVLSAFRTALPTLGYYLARRPLPDSDRPALFTMNILPPMMTVWYHFAKKSLGDSVDITIFDCSGKLKAADFPGARVQRFLNFYAATKSDEFMYKIAKNRRIGWICDDDVFLLDRRLLDSIGREFAKPGTASLSFRPRPWWHFDLDGRREEPSGSYCLAVDREIFAAKEHLSFAPANGNNHPSHIGKRERRYDTFDKANEILLQKGYRCAIAPPEEQQYIAAFSGLSGAVMLLAYHQSPQDVLDYLLAPEKRLWSGNMLFGILSALLAVCTIQELYTKLKGKPYPLPSLPSRAALEKIRRDHAQYLRKDHSLEEFDSVGARLHASL